MSVKTNMLVEELILMAKDHGAADVPDMEVGDLQDMLRRVWNALTDYQQSNLHRLLIDEMGYGPEGVL